MGKSSNFVRTAIVSISIALVSFACSTSLKEYESTSPVFDLRTFFDGHLVGWGLVKNHQNKVTKRFSVDMKGSWEGESGELYELFRYQDGTTQERIWYLENNSVNDVSGKASDVVGIALGKQKGFAFNWNYDLLVDVDGKEVQVHLQDWIYQIDERAVLSQAKIKKFGIPVGEVIVFILKQDVNS